jgi:FtsZ-binding cell division protein ZapB
MDTLEQLEKKITRAVELIESLKAENNRLKSENGELRREFEGVQARLKTLEDENSRKSEKIKGRLTSILDKLESLEEAVV